MSHVQHNEAKDWLCPKHIKCITLACVRTDRLAVWSHLPHSVVIHLTFKVFSTPTVSYIQGCPDEYILFGLLYFVHCSVLHMFSWCRIRHWSADGLNGFKWTHATESQLIALWNSEKHTKWNIAITPASNIQLQLCVIWFSSLVCNQMPSRVKLISEMSCVVSITNSCVNCCYSWIMFIP